MLLLSDSRIDPTISNHISQTPLDQAISLNQIEMARCIFEKLSSPPSANSIISRLWNIHEAVEDGNIELTERCLKFVNINHLDIFHRTPLHIACWKGICKIYESYFLKL